MAALASIVVLALSFSAAPQSGGWQLGKYGLLPGEYSRPLEVRAGKNSLRTYSFVGKVGGIAFESVAVLAPSLHGKQISLSYDANRPDGQRLIIAVDGATYVQPIYDWMLIPIINYANSDYNAVVSLFGENTTDHVYDIVYHPAFENTLLGVRLLQADIIFFDLGETWRLPKLGGQTILGAGEKPIAGEGVPRYRAQSPGCSFHQILEAPEIITYAQNGPEHPKVEIATRLHDIVGQEPFQSWVMTDQGESIFVESGGDRLLLGGSPYYYFWKAYFAEYERERDELKRQAANARAQGNVSLHNQIVEAANRLEPRVTEVYSITRELRQNRRLLYDFNPPVYGAATTVMQYSALFRLIKSKNKQNWEDFLANTRGVQVTPSVPTPTRWVRPVPRHPQRAEMTPFLQTTIQSAHPS